jgi:hypothetical protein
LLRGSLFRWGFVVVVFAVLGFELGLVLTRQALCHLSHSPSIYAFVIFEIESHLVHRLAWTAVLLLTFSK